MKMNNTYLHFVAYKDIPNWSVGYISRHTIGFTQKYPMVKIGKFICPSKSIVLVDDKVEYKQITLKINGGGAVLRGKQKGNVIGTKKQFIAKQGQFIMSKIDARNGAFGIVTAELDGAIVTGDFPLFDVDNTLILTEYLFLISTTKAFARFAQSCSRGTTNRQRIDVNLFLQQQIPLPSLAEQQALVDAYNHNLRQATILEQQAENGEKEIENNFAEILGIIKHNPQTFDGRNRLLFANYAQISQWGVDFILQGTKGIHSSKYPCYLISDICVISSGGTPNRGRKDYFGGNIPWIKTGELRNEILTDTEEKITEEGLLNSSAKLYPKGSLAIAMYGATIGKTAKFGIDATTNQACAVLTRIKEDVVLTDYLWLYLQTQTDNLKAMAYGGAQPNINAGIIANYKIPLPPLDMQAEIVAVVQEQRTKIVHYKSLATTLRQEAITQFEHAIFE